MVLDRTKRTTFHAVEVQRPVQVIDLVLQDACVPSRSLNYPSRPSLIQTLHTHLTRARHDRGEARHAEAPLEELNIGGGLLLQHWINDHVKRDRLALAHGDLFGSQAGEVFL